MTEEVNKRQEFIVKMHENYKILLESIKSLPFEEKDLQQGYLFLDTGMLWIKERILFNPIKEESKPEEQAID